MRTFIALFFFTLPALAQAPNYPPPPIMIEPPPIAALFPPAPAGQRLALHNGSLMAVEVPNPGVVVIRYAEPKPVLLEIGVVPGTLLFEGRWRGNTLFGQARVFNLQCGPIPYEVRGSALPDGTLVLRGPQLRVNQFCQPYYLEWTVNSDLVFTQLPPRQP